MIWTTQSFDVLKLTLDPMNPRFYFSKDISQEEIRMILLEREQIVDLATKIVNYGGLYPGERIIVCKENRKNIVLEGNRRVCACQLLLKPNLVPPSYQNVFPKIQDSSLIKQIEADIAPKRMDAEPILTTRHTSSGVKPWTVAANTNRFKRFYEEENRDLLDIKKLMGLETNPLSRLAQQYHIMKLTASLPCWDENELKILQQNADRINPFCRFFTLSDTRALLKIHSYNQNNDYRIISDLDENVFNKQIEIAARAFIFDKTADTRSKAKDVLGDLVEIPGSTVPVSITPAVSTTEAPKANTDQPKSGSAPVGATGSADGPKSTETPVAPPASSEATPSSKGAKSVKPSNPFGGLICTISDNIIIQLTDEITRLSKYYRTYPISMVLLSRSLLESTLHYQITQMGLYSTFINSLKTSKPNKKDPGLSDYIKFAIGNSTTLFPATRLGDNLNTFSSGPYKNYLDIIVHSKWAMVDYKMIESCAKLLEPIISYIINPPK